MGTFYKSLDEANKATGTPSQPAPTGEGPQQTSVPNLQDVKPAGPGMAAAHSIGNGLTFGLPDQIMARHLADKYQIPLDQAFGLIKQHFAGGESQLPKGLEMAASAAPMAAAPELTIPMLGLNAIGHTESQNPVDIGMNAANSMLAGKVAGPLLQKA